MQNFKSIGKVEGGTEGTQRSKSPIKPGKDKNDGKSKWTVMMEKVVLERFCNHSAADPHTP